MSYSSKIVCFRCNESKAQDMVMTETHTGENPFVLISKTGCLISYSLFHFYLFLGYCLEESSKGNLPSILFGKKKMMLEQFSLECRK